MSRDRKCLTPLSGWTQQTAQFCPITRSTVNRSCNHFVVQELIPIPRSTWWIKKWRSKNPDRTTRHHMAWFNQATAVHHTSATWITRWHTALSSAEDPSWIWTRAKARCSEEPGSTSQPSVLEYQRCPTLAKGGSSISSCPTTRKTFPMRATWWTDRWFDDTQMQPRLWETRAKCLTLPSMQQAQAILAEVNSSISPLDRQEMLAFLATNRMMLLQTCKFKQLVNDQPPFFKDYQPESSLL